MSINRSPDSMAFAASDAVRVAPRLPSARERRRFGTVTKARFVWSFAALMFTVGAVILLVMTGQPTLVVLLGVICVASALTINLATKARGEGGSI